MATAVRTQQHRPLMPMATAIIGPDSWRNSTIKNIKMSQETVKRGDKGCDLGRSLDPLPSLRDNAAQQSNTVAHQYTRETRQVVYRLRESLVDTNEEVKSLIRAKEALEKAIEHKRKDIVLNKLSIEVRWSRPNREKEQDGADELLEAERKQLIQLKKLLEINLKAVQKQLQELDQARKRLSAVLQERNRVLDLICHSGPSGSGRNSRSTPTRPQDVPLAAQPQLSFGANGLGYSRQIDLNLRAGSPQKDVPEEVRATLEPGYMPVDPLGPLTPDAAAAMAQARDARQKSAALRKEAREAIEKTYQLQKSCHGSINDGLTQKLAETITLKQHLLVASGENRAAVHRAQRWYDSTDRAKYYTLGPEQYSDLGTRERLDRPLIRVYQRHPGTNLPEAQDIIKGNTNLDSSLMATSRNIGLMQYTNRRIKDDLHDKKAASDIDASILRLRRRRANHRWVMGHM